MPEGPEAEICRRQLERWLCGQVVSEIVLVDPACVRTKRSTRVMDADLNGGVWLQQHLLNHRITSVLRHGKRIALRWPGGALLLHLGMTGKWVLRRQPLERHLRIALRTDREQWVCFVDMRRFGCLVPVLDEPKELLKQGLGPDALTEHLSADALRQRFRPRQMIKVALMDQSAIAGIGNIHATEVLWQVGVHPKKAVQDLARRDWEQLSRCIPAHLNQIVDDQDSDEMHYVSQGAKNPFRVYGRAGAICSRCNGKIQNVKIQGRSTFFCDSCQLL